MKGRIVPFENVALTGWLGSKLLRVSYGTTPAFFSLYLSLPSLPKEKYIDVKRVEIMRSRFDRRCMRYLKSGLNLPCMTHQ